MMAAPAWMLIASAAPWVADEPVSFHREVMPILRASCQGCHQPARKKGELDLTSHAMLMRGGKGGPSIAAGEPGRSFLLELVRPFEGEPPEMPDRGEPLSEAECELISRWIAAGALDDTPEQAEQSYSTEHPPSYPRPPILTSLAYSPDGDVLAVAGYHEVLLHGLASGTGGTELRARLVGLSERIESVAFSPDGTRLAVAGGTPGQSGELQIWRLEGPELERSIAVTHDTLFGASWSPDGELVAFGCTDNSFRAVEVNSGGQVLYQGAHADWVLGTAFSTDGTHLATVSRDRSLKLTRVESQQFIDNITSITPGVLSGGLMSVDRHPARDELLVGGADGVPKLFRMYREKKRVIGDDYNLLRAFDAMTGRVFAVRWSRDGTRLAAVSSGHDDGVNLGQARLYAESDAAPLWSYDSPGGLYALAFRPDGQVVAVGGAEGIVRFLAARTGRVTHELVPVPLSVEETPEVDGAQPPEEER